MAFGTDYTPVGPMPTDIVLGDVDATSMRLARDIRDKGHGIDTRETMARMILKSSTMHNHLIKVNNALKVQNDEYYRQFTDVMKELSEDKDFHSLPEIAGARGGFDTLGERLNNEHNEVTTLLEPKIGGGVKANLEDLSSTVLGAIQGGGGTSFNLLSVPQDNSVNNAKLKSDLKRDIYNNIDGYISDKKVGINKLNPDTVIYGGYYNEYGTWVANAQVGSSDFISVKPGQTVRYLQTEQISAVITFWNGMGEFVKGAGITSSSVPVGNTAVYPAPEGAKYFKVSVWQPTMEEQMITVDDAMPSSYKKYEYTQSNLKIEKDNLSKIGVSTAYGNLTPGDTFDFNDAAISGYGYGYSSGKNIINAPDSRNVDNAFYYWSFLNESGPNKFINQFYIDAITGEMWLRNSIIKPTGVLSTLSGWVKIGANEHEDRYQKIQGIGDSIMYGLPDTGTGRLAKPWISQIASYFKSDVINLGINSSTIATNNSGDNPVFNSGDRNPIVERLDAIDTSADLTILEGGINDYWIGVPLGEFNSRDTDTFYGALHAYYGGVAEMLHDKQVVVMTCLQSTQSNPNGVSLYDWTRAQVEVANYYSLPIFDAYNLSGISPNVISQKTNFMADGLHLSQAGADRLSERFISYL